MSRSPSPCLDPLVKPPAADRLLIVRLGAVGDVIRTLPAAARIRGAYPGAHLAWLVEPAASSVLRAQSWLDDVVVFPRNTLSTRLRRAQLFSLARELAEFLRTLRAPRFDLVVDFHSILRSGLLSVASGARMRVAYAPPIGREFSYAFATHLVRLEPRRMSRFERNSGLADFLATNEARNVTPLEVGRAAMARLRGELRDRAAAILHPGTSEATPYKRYTAEGYAAVARGLADQLGLRSMVTCGPGAGEREAAEAIVAASGGAAEHAPETPSLEDLAALCRGSRIFIGSDSGPLHLASLVGTPVVQLLGPTDPVENAPHPGTPSRSVRVPMPCSPCRKGCAVATCMRSISPESVIAAASELLSTPAHDHPAVAVAP